jgi:hypothetical protein
MELDEPHVLDGLLGSQPLLSLLQQPPYQIPAGFAKFLFRVPGEGELSPHDVRNGLTVVLRLKWGHSGHQFKHSHSQCPQVDPFIIPSSLEHLRSTVIGRPSQSQHLLLPPTVDQLLTDAKVYHLDTRILMIEQNVLRFDIPMADLMRMDEAERLQQLVDQFLQQLSIGQGTC